jgi:hypothetical protein
MGLVERAQQKIEAQRKKNAAPNPTFTGGQEIDAALVAWCQGLEDAIAEVALEVEKLALAMQGKSPRKDN